MVKELAVFNTPLDGLVPECVIQPLKEKIQLKIQGK